MSKFRNAAVLALLLLAAPLAGLAASGDYRFELAGAPANNGTGTLVKLRMVSVADGKPVTGAEITATRLDMGPDGMAAMLAPVRPLPSSEPGIYEFEIRPTMPGNWGLTVTVKLPGEAEPITGAVTIPAAN